MTDSAKRSGRVISQAEFRLAPDPLAAAHALVAQAVTDAVRQRGRAVLCLSGGKTPLPLYRSLAERADLPWERTVFAFGDERYVPHDHPDSNYGTIKRVLLDAVAAPGAVLAWPILDSPEASVAAYARLLRSRLGPAPLFDLNLLGLGPDAHTASLFPGTGAATSGEFAVVSRAPSGQARLSLTPGTLSSSRLVLFLVLGDAKAEALSQSFGPRRETAPDPDRLPATAITAFERLLVVSDVPLGIER